MADSQKKSKKDDNRHYDKKTEDECHYKWGFKNVPSQIIPPTLVYPTLTPQIEYAYILELWIRF